MCIDNTLDKVSKILWVDSKSEMAVQRGSEALLAL